MEKKLRENEKNILLKNYTVCMVFILSDNNLIILIPEKKHEQGDIDMTISVRLSEEIEKLLRDDAQNEKRTSLKL